MSTAEPQNLSDADNLCVVCFKNVEIYSIGCCDHAVCFECSTRMRVLCKQNECPICRGDLPKVIFTKKIEPYSVLFLRFERSNLQERKLGILFCTYEIQKCFFKLLEHRCQICDNLEHKWAFKTFQQLKDHMRREHELFYCDICSENLKIFSFERKCYTRQELAHHRRKGDKDNTSHRGHPLCEFCDTRFMDNDELFRHLRRNHLFCHLCDADGKHQYYNSMDDLKRHFGDEHFLCEEGDCKTMPLTAVFRTDIDLKAHITTEHGKYMTKSATKQARTLELEFTLAPRPRTDHTKNRKTNDRRERYDEDSSYNVEPGGPGGGYTEQSRTFVNTLTPDNFPALGNVSSAGNVTVSKNYMKFSNAAFSNNDFPSLGGVGGRPTPALTITTNSLSSSNGRAPEVTITRTIRSQASSQKKDNFPTLSGPSTSSGSSTLRFSVNNSEDLKAPKVSIHVNQNSNGGITTHIKTTSSASTKQPDVFPALGKSAPVAQPLWVQPKPPKKQEELKNSKVAPFPQIPPTDMASFPTLSKAKGMEKVKKTSSVTMPVSSWVNLNNINTNAKSRTDNSKKIVKQHDKSDKRTDKKPSNKTNSSLDVSLKDLKLIEVNQRDKSDKAKKKKNKTIAAETDSIATENGVEKGPNQNEITMKRSELKIGALSNSENIIESAPFSAKPPPGFNVKATPPPPGFNNFNFPILGTTNDLTFTSSSGQSYSIMPTNTNVYKQPQSFQRRNQDLIKKFLAVLQDSEAIKDFKNSSDQFRKGLVEANEYYDHCKNVLGNHFDEIFPELLVLLPDIGKQQELYQTLSEKNKSNLLLCKNCGQVILKTELSEHYNHHRLESHFPDLGTAQHVNNAWKK
ncbi:E3 ubiquitin-protein ligase ZNF598-like isoform X2 [Cylas formicarius]|uniref:E3 ubiquitin-protein ligase ZNF598-like isoform X2 n=1 Tax=Cylas formicarius TaxID=197179 RepID=UPI0029589613|nr:E3 ubiquitin-protein ligase ZNF598-like isoform X2 [Cylas formicarius]